MLPIESSDKAVLSLIVDHANPITGRADPGQLRIARLLGLGIRTVKRPIRRLLKTPYLSRTLRGLSSTAYQVHWVAILRHDKTYEAAKRCQTCPLDGDRVGPSVVSDLSPKNEKGKRKEKTKHEMALSEEGAFLDAYQNGLQENGVREAPNIIKPLASQIGSAGFQGGVCREAGNKSDDGTGPRPIGDVSRQFWSQRRKRPWMPFGLKQIRGAARNCKRRFLAPTIS
jgi:hypothetical protein